MTSPRFRLGVLAVGAALAAGAVVLVSPAAACDNAKCSIEPIQAAAEQAPEQPLKLKKFMRRPIATAAVRSVQTTSGGYAQVKLAHHSRHHGRARLRAASHRSAKTDMAADEPVVAPQTTEPVAAMPPAATAAAAGVQVVTADEVNAIDMAAGNPPADVAAEPVAAMANASAPDAAGVPDDAVAAGAPAAAAPAAPPPQVIAKTADETPADSSWAKQMAMVLGGAFAAAAAAGRMLMA
jgi:hypothetical protein